MFSRNKKNKPLRFLLHIKHSALSLQELFSPEDEAKEAHPIKLSSATLALFPVGATVSQLWPAFTHQKVLFGNYICQSDCVPASFLVWPF